MKGAVRVLLPAGAVVAALAVALALRTGSAPAEVVSAERWLMGTRWVVKAVPAPGATPEATATALAAALDEVARVEAVMSEWRPESPVSALNAAAGGPAIEVPAELFALLERAVDLGRRTDGAFDVTWKGMGRLWDLGAEEFAPPADAEIEAARQRVDYRLLELADGRARLPRADMAVGLGGIAKGYGVDRAGAVLGERGVTDFVVDGGGDLLVRGTRGGRPWRVGIRDPRGAPADLLTVVETTAGAVVTSGDYERFREVDGVRYHHIIDPRTGRPAPGCQQVTVVAPSAETADALATGLFVLGPSAGLAVVEELAGVEALIVDAQGRLHPSSGFPAALPAEGR